MIVMSAVEEPPSLSVIVTRTTYVPGAVRAVPERVQVQEVAPQPLESRANQEGRPVVNEPPATFHLVEMDSGMSALTSEPVMVTPAIGSLY
jgi:hypothetical protein